MPIDTSSLRKIKSMALPVSSGSISVTLSIDEFVITFFTNGPGDPAAVGRAEWMAVGRAANP